MKKFQLFLILLVFSNLTIKAQSIKLDFNDKLRESEVVIEGRVISQEQVILGGDP